MGLEYKRSLEEVVFWEIFYRRRAQRRDLVRRLGVSATTMWRATEVLLGHQVITATDAEITSRGRKPDVLEVNPCLAYLLGLEIDRGRVTAVVTDMVGGLKGRGSAVCNLTGGLEGTMRLCRQVARTALSDAGVGLNRISRVGAGHTGALDVKSGVCLSWGEAPAWKSVPLRAALANAFGIEVTLDDRARAQALAERLNSANDVRHPNAIYVHVGTGIGCGVFIDSRLVRGASLAAGEIGHMVIDREGPLCACGSIGCVEALASGPAIVRHVKEGMRAGRSPLLLKNARGDVEAVDIDDIVRAAKQGDPLAVEAVREAGKALGAAIANAVQLLNPSLVVLCGRLANAAREQLLDPVWQTIRERCFEMSSRGLEIRVATPRKDITAIGCALLAACDQAAYEIQQRLFSPVVGRHSIRKVSGS